MSTCRSTITLDIDVNVNLLVHVDVAVVVDGFCPGRQDRKKLPKFKISLLHSPISRD